MLITALVAMSNRLCFVSVSFVMCRGLIVDNASNLSKIRITKKLTNLETEVAN